MRSCSKICSHAFLFEDMFPQFNHVAGRSCLTQEGFLNFLFSIFSPTIEMPTCQRAPIGVFGLFFFLSSSTGFLTTLCSSGLPGLISPAFGYAAAYFLAAMVACLDFLSFGQGRDEKRLASLWWLEINFNRQQNFCSSTCSLNFLRSKAMLVALTVFLCFSSSYRCGKLFDCL